MCISHATLNRHDSTEATSTLVRQAHLKKYFISIGSTFSGHTGYTSDLVAWILQRDRSSEAEFREANCRLANDSLLCFITNVLRFENSRRENRGVGGGGGGVRFGDIRVKQEGFSERGDWTYTRTNANVVYRFTSRLCILTSTNLILKLPHRTQLSLSLSLSLFHAYTHSFLLSLSPLTLSRAADSNEISRERSARINITRTHNIFVMENFFNKHRRTFRCFHESFFLFFSFSLFFFLSFSIQRIYIGLPLTFWQRFDDMAFV